MRLYRARALASMWRNAALSSSRVNSPLHISTWPSTSIVSTPEDHAVEDVVDGVQAGFSHDCPLDYSREVGQCSSGLSHSVLNFRIACSLLVGGHPACSSLSKISRLGVLVVRQGPAGARFRWLRHRERSQG